MIHKPHRPKFLNLFILAPKLSVTAKASILHRISGVLLFLLLPFLLYLFHRLLTESDFYSAFYGFISEPIAKLIYIVLLWGFIYHALCGLRFVLMDTTHKGIHIKSSKISARIVIILSIILTGILGALIW